MAAFAARNVLPEALVLGTTSFERAMLSSSRISICLPHSSTPRAACTQPARLVLPSSWRAARSAGSILFLVLTAGMGSRRYGVTLATRGDDLVHALGRVDRKRRVRTRPARAGLGETSAMSTGQVLLAVLPALRH